MTKADHGPLGNHAHIEDQSIFHKRLDSEGHILECSHKGKNKSEVRDQNGHSIC